jgi:tripartite motif-containing protein 71
MKSSLLISSSPNGVVAGTGSPGSAPNQLSRPNGIFVNVNFDLYVADNSNNRIQKFSFGQWNGTTVAGDGTSNTITLGGPTAVALVADGYLFIVDNSNNRIVGSGPNGFRCLAACSGSSGSQSNQLMTPRSLSFDSYGNIFVTDTQKFLLLTTSIQDSRQ